MWEKKSDDSDFSDGDNPTFPHNKDNLYTWDEAFTHVATLNNICQNDETVDCSVNGNADCAGVGGKCGFAGKRDWRVPNVKELTSIIDYQNRGPAVSPAFNENCAEGATVLAGSCTEDDDYWSSTSEAGLPSAAWYVHSRDGDVLSRPKSGPAIARSHVRAVRGGL